MLIQLRSFLLLNLFIPFQSSTLQVQVCPSKLAPKVQLQKPETKKTKSKLNKIHKMEICLGELCEISHPKPPYTTTEEITEVEDILDPCGDQCWC
jgi:hypothetical protein